MANLNNELNILVSQLEKAGVSTDNFRKQLQASGNSQEEIVRLTREMQTALSNVEGSATNLYDRLKAVTSEMKRGSVATNMAAGAYYKLTQLASQLSDDEAGIVDLSKNQTKALLEKAKIQQKALNDLGRTREIQELLLSNDNNLTEKQLAIKKAYEDQNREAGRVLQLATERLEQEKRISKQMGVTGAVIGGTGALMERLGMRSGIFHDAVEDAQTSMRAAAKQADILGNKVSKLEIAFIGINKLAKGFGNALLDPAVLGTKILDAFFEVNKEQVDFIRYTGQASASLGGVNTEIASMTDMLKTATEFTKQTGLNAAAIFTPQQIGQIADATELLGISANQATQLGMVMKQTGKSADEIGNAIYTNVDAGISNKAVYDDVLSASDDIVASSGGNVKALSRAASAAKKLGLNLSRVNQIADGLLDFESSIESELEAQLLTGKNINLNKARELALNNDLEGVAKELQKNGASAAEFAKMTRISQQSLAKAMGMSREELGKMVLTKEAMAKMSDKEIANARGMTIEQSKQMDIQARIQKSVDRLAQAFAPILEAVVPIVEALLSIIRPLAAGIGYLLKFKAVSYALTGIFATIATSMAAMRIASFTGAGIKGFNTMRESLTGIGKGLKDLPGLLGKAKKGIQDAFQTGLGSKVRAKSGELFDKNSPQGKMIENMKKGGGKTAEAGKGIADSSKATKAVAPGNNIKVFLTNLSEGLQKMGTAKVLYGALNLIPASLGFISMIPGAIGMAAIAALGKPTSKGLQALGRGLIAFGIAMKGPGGVGLLAFVGAAIGLGAAFALVGAGAMMFGKGIEFAANGVIKILTGLTGLTSSIPQLYLLGGALMSIAAGLGAISVAGIAALPALLALTGLGTVATPLAKIMGNNSTESSSEESTLKNIEKKLASINDHLAKGTNVYLDSEKIFSSASQNMTAQGT